MFSSLVQAASFFPEGLLRSVKYLSVPKANVKIQMFLGTSVPCLCSYACVERPICYTFSWDWSMDRNETPARDSNHEVPCGEKCWFLAWKRLWPNSGAFELGHQFQELTSLIFLMGQMMVSSMGLSKNGWFTYLRSIEARPGFAPSLEATTGPERQMPWDPWVRRGEMEMGHPFLHL